MPFRVGERLNYRVSWATFANAATVELNVPEQRDLFGWHTLHFRAQIHTLNSVRSLFTIDDEFDSYSDAGTLDSRQYEMYLDEMGRKQDRVLHFIPKGQAPRASGAGVIVLPGTRDPLGALYAVRAWDWQKRPELVAPVYDGQNLYELRGHLEGPAERISVSGENYTASQVSIRLFQYQKEVAGTRFSVWLAEDPARTPVRMLAEMPFGTLRIELTSTSR